MGQKTLNNLSQLLGTTGCPRGLIGLLGLRKVSGFGIGIGFDIGFGYGIGLAIGFGIGLL